MKKSTLGFLIILVMIIGFGVGYSCAFLYQNLNVADYKQKPVLNVENKNKQELINQKTQIIYEREYLKSGQVIISEFPNQEDLWGKSIEEIKSIYLPENGYNVTYNNNTLTVREAINDWSPQDKEKCRLKEYKGMVAIYVGPTCEQDILAKVTAIHMDSLPQNIQTDIKEGKYEFANETELNYAMENLDEFF